MTYDSTQDTLDHRRMVRDYLVKIADELDDRGRNHDASKLKSPEKEMFDEFRPKLDSLDIQSEEYKQALKDMGDALKHHYANNRHHPEFNENGIRGMTLIDVAEMVCDWLAASKRKDPNGKVNMQWVTERFGLQPDDWLFYVIDNTLKMMEKQ